MSDDRSPHRKLVIASYVVAAGLAVTSSVRMSWAQTVIQTGETRTESVQRTRETAKPRTAADDGEIRATLQRIRALVWSDDVFVPEKVGQSLRLPSMTQSGRYRPTSPNLVSLRPDNSASAISGATLILKPETGQVFRGSELRIAFSSEQFGCFTVADMEEVIGSAYEKMQSLPFPPPYPKEVEVDAAIFSIAGTVPKIAAFKFHYMDCLGSIEVVEGLDQQGR